MLPWRPVLVWLSQAKWPLYQSYLPVSVFAVLVSVSQVPAAVSFRYRISRLGHAVLVEELLFLLQIGTESEREFTVTDDLWKIVRLKGKGQKRWTREGGC